MSDSIRFFPNTSAEALATIYVNSLDLSEKSPEDIARIYDDAFYRIKAEQKKIREEKTRTSDWLT